MEYVSSQLKENIHVFSCNDFADKEELTLYGQDFVHGVPFDAHTASSLGVINPGIICTVKHKNSGNWTPLMYAAVGGHYESVDDILQLGANPDDVDEKNWTALMHAVSCGHSDIVRLLYKYGSDIGRCDFDGNPVIFLAIQYNHLKLVYVLLQLGVDVNCRSSHDGLTMLMLACKVGFIKLVEFLLKKGANPLMRSYDGKTAIDFCENPDIRKLLLSVGSGIGSSLPPNLSILLKMYNLDKYFEILERNKIDLKKFFTMTAEDLKKLGITFGPRKLMLSIIERTKLTK